MSRGGFKITFTSSVRYSNGELLYIKSLTFFKGDARAVFFDVGAKHLFGEATKGVRRMPRLWKATKDVANCDKLGRGVYDL